MKNSKSRTDAFTRTELVIVTAILGLLGLLFVRAQDDPAAKERQQRLQCVTNLKMAGLSFRMWANDNSDLFPMRTPAAKSGTKEAIDTGETFRHFAALSNYLPDVKHLTCPSDDRIRANSFGGLRNTNLSYFAGLDADEVKPQMLLSGDRNLTNGVPLKNGVMILKTEAPEGWTAALHGAKGNLGLADGSVQQVTTMMLRRQIQAQAEYDTIRARQIQAQAVSASVPEPQRLQFPE